MIDKISVWLAVAILGYLAYTTVEKTGFSIETEKELPAITKKMLSPELIEPNDNASPVGRDPFGVDWATYFDISEMTGVTLGETAEGTTAEGGVDRTEERRVFSKTLMGILTSGDGRDAALIDGRVYQVGSLIDGAYPKTCWKVETITRDEVVVGRGNTKQSLKIVRRSAPRHTMERDMSQEVHK